MASCVVGLKDGKNIWLGCEGLASDTEGLIRSHDSKKIFQNGKYWFGFVGSVRTGQIFEPVHFIPPKDLTDLPDAMMEQCEAKCCLLTDAENGGLSVMGSNFLVAHKGKLYEVLIDFQIREIPDFSAIGSGSPPALGSLLTSEGLEKDPRKRVFLALRAAIHYCGSCGGIVTIEKIGGRVR
jgi:hypothetical protein